MMQKQKNDKNCELIIVKFLLSLHLVYTLHIGGLDEILSFLWKNFVGFSRYDHCHVVFLSTLI